jgi:hypothetical protein
MMLALQSLATYAQASGPLVVYIPADKPLCKGGGGLKVKGVHRREVKRCAQGEEGVKYTPHSKPMCTVEKQEVALGLHLDTIFTQSEHPENLPSKHCSQVGIEPLWRVESYDGHSTKPFQSKLKRK